MFNKDFVVIKKIKAFIKNKKKRKFNIGDKALSSITKKSFIITKIIRAKDHDYDLLFSKKGPECKAKFAKKLKKK